MARYVPATGEIEWTVTCRETSRSDTHAITVHAGSVIEITGSPSRSMGLGNNVFGTLDIREAARAHIAAAEQVFGFSLPRHFSAYRVGRVDVTCNYDMGALPEVRQVLAYLRQADGGRYKLGSKCETVYWSQGSRRRSGKAYAKGPHLDRQCRHEEAAAETWQRDAAQGLVRLELKLAAQWWSEQQRPWWQFQPAHWMQEHEAYFGELIGTPEVVDMVDVRKRLLEVAPTEGQARAAHDTWCRIHVMGHKAVQDSMTHSTWYRHLGLLKRSGLGWGDIAAGEVVPIRRKPLVLSEPVRSWDELRKSA